MDAKVSQLAVAVTTSGFNPRARDGRELVIASTAPTKTSFNPRARDGREFKPPTD